jgi:hypothetical protein
MPYSKEFIDWTGAQGIEPDFEIRLVSGNMTDGMSSDVQCDGLHFVGMYKRSDGMLLLKMKSSNEEGNTTVQLSSCVVAITIQR